MDRLLQELKRRKVIRVATMYAVVAWVLFYAAVAFTEPESASSVILQDGPSEEIFEYINQPSNSNWESSDFDDSIYDKPYQISLFKPQNGEDSERLWSQTKSMLGYIFTAAGIITLLPADARNFDGIGGGQIRENWSEHVSEVMEWDRNTPFVNYVGHPYAGGMYYQMARKSGYRQWDSFVYATLMSTLWEYGIEAVSETPSIQDLFLTPTLGWVVGEWMFNTEQVIRQQGGNVWGSPVLGNTALFFLDPIDSLGEWVNNRLGRRLVRAGTGYISYSDVPIGNTANAPTEKQLKVGFQYTLGRGNEPVSSRRYHAITNDPVDTGIVGISLGAGYLQLDDQKEVMVLEKIEYGDFKAEGYPEWTVGLYFSPRYSARLRYGRTKVKDIDTRLTSTYENYGIDGQYYFNANKKTRPYITAGIGEEIFDKNKTTKTVLWNVGLGLHHQINNNWSVYGSLLHQEGPSEDTINHSISVNLLYRFGRGDSSLGR